jgi:hypothetical protein
MVALSVRSSLVKSVNLGKVHFLYYLITFLLLLGQEWRIKI